ncbi:MAG: dodecin domain-containing protein [Armatimonadetes bacterium]|nr:MAG: dodecin domain-containing protein [Armatimonadota bacterium]
MDIETGAHKIIEIMGVSPTGFEQAIDQAVSKASESINGITGVEVVRQAADVRDGRVVTYRVTVKLSFVVN